MLRRTRLERPRLVFYRGHLGRGFWGQRYVLGGGLLAGVEGRYVGEGIRMARDALCCVVGQKGVHVWPAGGGMHCLGYSWAGRRV